MEFFSERREVSKVKRVSRLHIGLAQRGAKGAFFMKLRATAAIAMTLVSTAPSWALGPQTTQQQTQPPATAQAAIQTNSQSNTDPALQGLPPEPAPNYTQPLYMRPTSHDYSKPRGYWPNLF